MVNNASIVLFSLTITFTIRDSPLTIHDWWIELPNPEHFASLSAGCASQRLSNQGIKAGFIIKKLLTLNL